MGKICYFSFARIMFFVIFPVLATVLKLWFCIVVLVIGLIIYTNILKSSFPTSHISKFSLPFICYAGLYSSSQHNFRMQFLVHSSSQRILGNLMAANRSSLVLKFKNVANTDFLATPFFAASDRWNFGYIPFLFPYNHIWRLNRGFVSR